MKRLILGSGSERRKELLKQMNLSFTIQKSDVDEKINRDAEPKDIVMDLAKQKAEAVAKHYQDDIVLGADTIVSYKGQLLGKPKNREEAKIALQMLSGHTHDVLTGVALVTNKKTKVFHEKTEVTFWNMTDEEIDWYIQSGEPFDKAGSYGIQGLGAFLVKEIKGDYFSVVGLPLAQTMRELKNIGYHIM